jgi:hypothetical protein
VFSTRKGDKWVLFGGLKMAFNGMMTRVKAVFENTNEIGLSAVI